MGSPQAATAAGSRALRRGAFAGAGGGGDVATVTALGSLANTFLPALSSSGVASGSMAATSAGGTTGWASADPPVDADAELWTGDPELLIDDGGWRWRDLRD